MLGPSAFEREWAAGQGLAFETAIECMLEWLEGDPDGASGPIAQRPDVVKTPPESTARLLARVRKGDAGAEDLLVKQYLPILRRWAHGRLPMGSRGLVDTDDIVQMTLVQALRKVDRFEPRREGAFQGAFLGYLRQILLNQIRDEARRASRRPRQERLGRDFLDRAPSPLESMLARKTYQEYEAALAQLSDRQREAVILRAEMGFSYAEVADSIGSASENAARMMVQRAFHNLARRMKRAE
jgi:RNA polymerase sigma-70 factor (ECF subfamily)